ncbi:lysophospholipase [Roseiarcus fermentans]|uniref:Lysophospholipase n=1 Tax=Roseiarcus fermentans TaxID=1473586 RepID=A0A366FRB4_9HYPH|nr:alpha/beta hydrolase [Roseiarcus fermentans]RBP17158.1 lysophospholipase [Roseiarcus fermentans]
MPLASTSDNPAPPGAIEHAVRTADGVRLRAARWAPAGAARGTVAIFGGRGEFIEKYFEVARDLLARGFAVAALDWRGQGGSERRVRDASKGHVDDFAQFGRDLDAFTAQVLAPHCPRPWIGLGHSMGAAILLILDADGLRPFERLVLTSPMIAVKGVDHRGFARFAIDALGALGLGRAFAPGNARQTFWARPFAGNVFTTDPGRFARIARLLVEAPHLFLGGPTIGWARAAFRAMRRFDDPRVAWGDGTPALIVASGADRVTDRAAAERFAARLAPGSLVVIEGAEHEILIERDALRDQFWAAFDAFVAGAQSPSPPAAP